jgi:hypothetical protein
MMLERRLTVLTWMMGVLLVLTATTLWLTITIADRLPHVDEMRDGSALFVMYGPALIWWLIFLKLMRDDKRRAEARRRDEQRRA